MQEYIIAMFYEEVLKKNQGIFKYFFPEFVAEKMQGMVCIFSQIIIFFVHKNHHSSTKCVEEVQKEIKEKFLKIPY